MQPAIPHDHSKCATVPTVNSIWTNAEYGLLPGVVHEVEHRGVSASKCDRYGYSALHYAAQRGHDEVVRYLLAQGADVDAAECGVTPLLRAAFAGREAVVRTLIDAGADVNAVDSATNGTTALHKASSQGHVRVCLILIANGADVQARDRHGRTALELCSSDQLRRVLTQRTGNSG